jgi:hypothetical protein
VCFCRRWGFWRLFAGVAGPDDARDEAEREAWRARRRRFRAQVRQALRELLAEDDAPRAEGRG